MNSIPCWLKAFLLLALLSLLAGGTWFYQSQEHLLRQRAENNLADIAQIKVNQIVAWRNERLHEATVLTASPFMLQETRNWLDKPGKTGEARILSRFRPLANYKDVFLVDPAGQVRLSLSGQIEPLSPAVQRTLSVAWQTHQPVLTTLFASGPDLMPCVATVAPLADGNTNAPIGAVVLVADARRILNPLAAIWPAASHPAETVLVEREGNSVLFLTELPCQTNVAFPFSIPLAHTNVVAVKAVLGQAGLIEGKDHRGAAVLADVRKIPQTAWFVITQSDVSEIFAAWRVRSCLILLVFLALIAATGSAVVAVWQRNLKTHYRTLHQTEASLRQSEQRRSIIFQSIGDAVIVTGANGRVELLNPVAETLTGWKEAAARGQLLETVFRIINEDTRQPAESPVHRVLKEGAVMTLARHTVLIAQDGTERPVASSGAPIRDERGLITGVVIVFRDQTAEHAAARALRASEERFRLLAESSVVGIYLIQDDRFRYVNPAFAAIFGYQAEEIMDRLGPLDVIHPDDRPRVAESIRRYLAGEAGALHYEFRGQRKNGATILVEAHDRQIEYLGRTGVVGSLADITERRQLEAQLLCSQRMETIGALASGIAHDLNNALTPVIIGTELLKQSRNGEQRQLLDTILASAKRGTDMVKQILSFARGSQSQTGPVQISSLIKEMTKILGDTLPKFIAVESDVKNDLWTVPGDATELHQVLLNLCVNARDAMPRGGQLTVAAENITLDNENMPANIGATPGAYVMLSVTDTGVGIPPDLLPRIFEPFFTTKPPGKGTGLGLSTVSNILKRLNGFIQIHSEVGKGTRFRIYLPAAQVAQTICVKRPEPELPTGHGELILVIDDEQAIRQLAKTTLENYGFRVVAAPNGLLGVTCFEEYLDEIKMVVSDSDMPFTDGLIAIRAIQKLKPDIHIIIASGSERDLEPLRHIDTTHVTTLNKPYTIEQLLTAVASGVNPLGSDLAA